MFNKCQLLLFFKGELQILRIVFKVGFGAISIITSRPLPGFSLSSPCAGLLLIISSSSAFDCNRPFEMVSGGEDAEAARFLSPFTLSDQQMSQSPVTEQPASNGSAVCVRRGPRSAYIVQLSELFISGCRELCRFHTDLRAAAQPWELPSAVWMSVSPGLVLPWTSHCASLCDYPCPKGVSCPCPPTILPRDNSMG